MEGGFPLFLGDKDLLVILGSVVDQRGKAVYELGESGWRIDKMAIGFAKKT